MTVSLVLVLMAAVGALGYVVEGAGRSGSAPVRAALAEHRTTPSRATTNTPSNAAEAPVTPAPSTVTAGRTPSMATVATLRPGRSARLPRVLGPGDTGDRVRDLQVRLRELAWYSPSITGRYDGVTRQGVRGFQAKRGFFASGEVDRRTLRRLTGMTSTPTRGELHNVVGSSASTSTRLDARCATGRAVCVDKTSQTLRWVVDGTVRATMAVRFGASYSPTREGVFHVGYKSADHVSHLYGSAMPFAMFFSGGQALHYSSDFAARGYAGASHGCVNVRDYDGIRWLFGEVQVGDKVVVYRA